MKLKWNRILIVLGVLIAIGVAVYFVFFNKEEETVEPEVVTPEEPVVEKELQILDLDSNTRPISVMINNHKSAQPYQAGLNDAYLVYEIVVEGGITRMLALYKDSDATKIGPIRSARHYYLDYNSENGAMYGHHGWSPQAKSQIASEGIDNIEIDDYKYGWRDKEIDTSYEHTLFTDYENLVTKASSVYKHDMTTTVEPLLNYSIEDTKINEMEQAVAATNVSIKYSSYQTNEFKYNEETMQYEKYSNGTASVDYVTKDPVVAKNIIVYEVRNYSIDSYGRQDIDNIGSGEGTLISNGYSIPIKWSKASATAKTVYTYLDGTEIDVNDGITHIQIMPTSGTLTINAN